VNFLIVGQDETSSEIRISLAETVKRTLEMELDLRWLGGGFGREKDRHGGINPAGDLVPEGHLLNILSHYAGSESNPKSKSWLKSKCWREICVIDL